MQSSLSVGDLETCSTSGFCFDGSSTEALVQANTPPTLYLRANEPTTTYIPRGTAYDVCEGSLSITKLDSIEVLGQPCEAGTKLQQRTTLSGCRCSYVGSMPPQLCEISHSPVINETLRLLVTCTVCVDYECLLKHRQR